MKAYAIVIRNNDVSEQGFKSLQQSSKAVGNKFDITRFEAITPSDVAATMSQANLKWNYPWVGKEVDFASGLTKSAYKTRNPDSRIACALSHYMLWKMCVKQNEPILILEHDAIFNEAIDFEPKDTNLFILGINNPLGATRKARDYYNKILESPLKFQIVPWIDDQSVPQGLAGNSAYIIKPQGAKRMIDLVHEYGLWPNDAIMCRQLLPRIGVTRKFYTTIQNLKSTTT